MFKIFRIFRILDLVVSLVLVALGVVIFCITKNWWAVIAISIIYIVWEIILIKTFFKLRKASNEIRNCDYESASETDEDFDNVEE